MGAYDDEKSRERYRQLRDKQLEARDPGPKVKNVNWNPERRYSTRPKSMPLAIWKALPGRYQGAAAGLIFGLIGLIFCVIVLPGDFKILGLAVMVICLAVGFILGHVSDPHKGLR